MPRFRGDNERRKSGDRGIQGAGNLTLRDVTVTCRSGLLARPLMAGWRRRVTLWRTGRVAVEKGPGPG